MYYVEASFILLLLQDNYEMSSEWLEFFDDPVLNDKMMTEASDAPVVKSEHSYSIGKQTLDGSSLIQQVKTEPAHQITLDDNPGPAVNPVSYDSTHASLLSQI